MNMCIDEIKERIYQGIDEEIENMKTKFNQDKELVKNTDNVPELVKQLVDIYGNSMEQRKVMAPILKQYLQGEFFKNAEVVGRANSLHFKNENYFIEFSTSRMYTILVGRAEELRKPIEPLSVREDIMELNNLWDSYKETGEGYNELINLYSIMSRGTEAGLFFTVKTKVTDIENYVKGQKQHIESVQRQVEQWKEDVIEYENQRQLFKELMEDVKGDLIKFQEKGWRIKYENIEEDEKTQVVSVTI